MASTWDERINTDHLIFSPSLFKPFSFALACHTTLLLLLRTAAAKRGDADDRLIITPLYESPVEARTTRPLWSSQTPTTYVYQDANHCGPRRSHSRAVLCRCWAWPAQSTSLLHLVSAR